MSVGMRLVLVEWVDSTRNPGAWQAMDDITADIGVAHSVGYLAIDTPDCIVVVPHFMEAEEGSRVARQGCGDMTIPRECIRSMRDLVVAEPSA